MNKKNLYIERNSKSLPTPLLPEFRKWFGSLPYNDPFVMSVSGEAFSGKSSFLLKLMTKLCGRNSRNKEGDRCLYLNIEEPLKRGNTIQQKCRNMKLSPTSLKYIDVIDDINSNFLNELEILLNENDYKYVVIDSVSMLAGASFNKHLEIWEFIKSRKESFICVLHYTKTKRGKMQGPTLWEHNPDVAIWLTKKDNYTEAEFKKNRYLDNKPLRKFNTYTEKVI